MIKAESLLDGTIDLAYIALLNEVLDIEQENNTRTQRFMASRKI
jgi:hypothetical protein